MSTMSTHNSIAQVFRACLGATLASAAALGGPAVLLFEDDFDRGIPGWTAVQPAGTYIDGPMRWQYDIVTGAFIEQSNIYTDASTVAPSATAVMLINDTVTGPAFSFKARLIAGDDDAFGLIFGYQDPTNFYRVTFTRQVRTAVGFPWNGWNVDRKVNGVATPLFGDGTPSHIPSFVNHQYVPFDVTIAVSGANLLTLTVVEDPDNAPVAFPLVQAQPLPGPAQGQVGLMTWGMSGTLVRGFRAMNPTLEPVGLAGNPNALTNWTALVTPRADGSGYDPAGANGGIPIWSLALGASGPFGTLHENSDSLGGNTTDARADFPAATVVAGDPSWSNYVYTARLIPADDDGFGIVLRYQDPLNFYRIALRAQSSGSGIRRGLSVQKVVGGVWEEIFYETAPQFAPPANVPCDVTAVVVGDRLQIQIVANPLGAAQVYSYGPFDITGATLATGRIGVFSWAMSRLETDFVRVYGIDGLPFQITSLYGNPEPAPGLYGYPAGSSVTASVPSPFEQYPGVRRISTGWTGAGSAPPSGTESQVTFTINSISSIVWNWRTELRLAATAGPGGTVSAPTAEWLPEGTNIVVTAIPSAGFLFAGWSGDFASSVPTLDLIMSRPYTLAARFEADSDGDTLPDLWEQANFTSLAPLPGDDPDHDGKSNLAEYQNGTDPNFAEALIVSDSLDSRWVNVQRDPSLPGQLIVRDFGGGFRGVWENSNDYRSANDTNYFGTNAVDNVSFEGPRIVIRTNIWNPDWTNFTAEATFSVGDNDGNCLYFRYRDEMNWYRVTICGENNNAVWRAPFGVSVQKRSNGMFSQMAVDPSIATDPTDVGWYKRIRITVTAAGPDFEVRVVGWSAALNDWELGNEHFLPFWDPDHAYGRVGVGLWGQQGGATATATNPVDAGVLIEDVIVKVANQEVFREDWEAVPLAAQIPAGWENPPGDAAPASSWQVTAHGTILQTSDYGLPTTGTSVQPRADADGTALLSPALAAPYYCLEIGFHPFDDDGIGFLYDYEDTNNYSRVLFVSQATADGRVPQGVNVSRKIDGAWSDLFLGDTNFIYQIGSPFGITFANNNGQCTLTARPLDDPAAVRTWSWAGAPGIATNRFGLACWGETDAHFLYARASSLPVREPAGDLKIARVWLEGATLHLEIENPGGGAYAVERSPTLLPGSWSDAATGQTGAQWSTPIVTGAGAEFFRLRR